MEETQIKRPTFHSIRLALMLFILLIGFVSIYVQRTSTGILGSQGWLHNSTTIPMAIQLRIMVGCLLVEELLLWFGNHLLRWQPWALFLPQLGFGILTSANMTGDTPIMMIGIIPVVAIEIITIYDHPKRPMLLMVVISGLALGVYALYNGWLQAILVLQGLLFVTFIIWFYWRFVKQQLIQRQHAEDLLAELKIAYSQVEESTVRTERQRVARELHDTLTQGLAGTVMQLEAAQAFLQSGKDERALDVIQGTIGIARDTLRDTRLTLTDLRATSEQSLAARLELLADAFKKNYQLATTIKLGAVPDYSSAQLTEINRIVSEAMINVVKHTDTLQVIIRGEVQDDIFRLQVIDFGQGAPAKKKHGHYGMQGMHERAAALDGALTVVSTPGEGTTVTLTMPTEKKEKL